MRVDPPYLSPRILGRVAASGVLVTGLSLALSGCPGGADLENVDQQLTEHSRVEGEYCDAPAIFETSCGLASFCHLSAEGSPLAGGIDLVAPEVGERMLDVSPSYPQDPDCVSTPRLLINSTDPEESYLWKKLTNTQDCGDPMPELSPADMNCVRIWMDWVIAGGASDGSTGGDAGIEPD